MATKRRVAQFRIDSIQRTEQGALKVTANLTKTGVFDYRLPNGETIREYRPPEEVFGHQALDSLHGSPVTLLHPGEFVTTGNWDLLAVGSVISVEKNEPYVTGTLLVHDARVIDKIEAGELKEISCGYSADIVPAPAGVEHYDAVQTSLNYNHAAIGPAQWGRLGSDVSLRLDANNQVILEEFMETQLDAADAVNTSTSDVTAVMNGNVDLSTVGYTSGTSTTFIDTTGTGGVRAWRSDEDEEEQVEEFDFAKAFEDLSTRFDEVLKRLDAQDEEPVAEDEKDPEADFEARVIARADLLDSVRGSYKVLCPDEEYAGKNIEALCVEGLKTVDQEGEGYDEAALIGMLRVAAKAKASVKVEDSTEPKKMTFAERLLNQRITEPTAKSFSDRLAESVS